MSNKFSSEQCMSHDKYYMITMPDKLYELAAMTKGSFNLIMPRLFGLSPVDFLRMARDNYNATLCGKKGYIITLFKDKKDCEKLCKELTERFNYWTKEC